MATDKIESAEALVRKIWHCDRPYGEAEKLIEADRLRVVRAVLDMIAACARGEMKMYGSPRDWLAAITEGEPE